MQKFNYNLFADYFQIYLCDDSNSLPDTSNIWTPDAVDRLLAVASGFVAIGTARNMVVPVTVEIHENEPFEDTTLWDHINECTLEISSGRIVVAGCTDYLPDATRITVSPGTYRARACYGNLNSVSEDGLQGDDRYRITLWPATPIPVRIIKRRKVAKKSE